MADETHTFQSDLADPAAASLLYQSVFTTMAEGVVCQSVTGEIIAVNPAAERILGRSGSQILGLTGDSPDWRSIHPDGTPFPGREHPGMVVLTTGRPASNVVMGLCRPDGARIWISINSHPLIAPEASRPYGVISTFHDVSTRVRAEQEIRRLNVKLEKRVSERTQELATAVKDLESFSYSVSHDLRAPLRAIDNFSCILQEEYSQQLDAEGQRLIGVVRKNARTMGILIDDILAFAHAGRRDLVLSDVDLEALTRHVLDELALPLAGRQVHVETVGLPQVRADAAALRQVLVNLLSNAIKFTRPREVAHIEVRASTVGGETICSVTDDGIGFDPQYSHKLFGIFQRLHSAEDFEGTGIGLGIVKRIIDKHGGRVWAKGTPDAGAAFYFTLPGPARQATL